jgi:hypothetical protein
MFRIRGFSILISCIIIILIAFLQGCSTPAQDYKQADDCFWKCTNAKESSMSEFPKKTMWQFNCEVVLDMPDGWNWLCGDGDTRTYWEKCRCIRFYETQDII